MDNVAAFLRYLASEKNYSAHTVRAYSKDIEGFATHCSDAYSLHNLSKVHYPMLRDYIIVLSKRGLTMRSINRKCSALKSLYAYFQKIGIIEVHPFAQHKAVKAKKAFITPFSVAELNTVLEQIDRSDFAGLRDATAIELLYGTGIRQANSLD